MTKHSVMCGFNQNVEVEGLADSTHGMANDEASAPDSPASSARAPVNTRATGFSTQIPGSWKAMPDSGSRFLRSMCRKTCTNPGPALAAQPAHSRGHLGA